MHRRIYFFSYALIVTVIALIGAINFQLFGTLFGRNVAMLNIARSYGNPSSRVDQQKIIVLLTKDVEMNPERLLTRARLASIFLETGNSTAAQQQIETYLSNGLNTSPCRQNQPSLLQAITYHSLKTQVTSLSFSQPETQWEFSYSIDAINEITFADDNLSNKCIAKVTINFPFFPQRYVILYRNVRVQPSHLYRLKAYTKASGIETAWFGIGTQWAGTSVVDSTDWQQIIFDFKTRPLQNIETIQFIVESGHGTLKIHDVTLEMLDP
jgi:hypothetical protein